jgi:4-alpha-glucanotransferase
MNFAEELKRRSAGVLLDPRSLPSKYGIGDLGPSAYRFVRFMANCRLRWWQILPLGMPADGRCPYSCDAGSSVNEYLISPDLLLKEGLLSRLDLANFRFAQDRIDYRRVLPYKRELLEKAYRRFTSGAVCTRLIDDFTAFTGSAEWLDDYALFRALKEEKGGSCWNSWQGGLAHREADALVRAHRRLSTRVNACKFWQFLFHRQWSALKAYTNLHGIRIIGDMPLYVSYDSADVWSNPRLFKLNELLQQTVVAGVPPDYFSESGQIWGNPMYRPGEMRRQQFRFWIERFRRNFELADVVRIDHFRGLVACYGVPVDHTDARHGTWCALSGARLLSAVQAALGQLPVIAEDLGVITPPVVALRDAFGFPGMLVQVFGLGGDSKKKDNPHVPYKFTRHAVAYTGTHDTDTVHGWYNNANPAEQQQARQILDSDGGRNLHWDAIANLMQSQSAIAIVPMQDFLGFPSWARMNTPGTTNESNWSWRCRPGDISSRLASRVRQAIVAGGRC